MKILWVFVFWLAVCVEPWLALLIPAELLARDLIEAFRRRPAQLAADMERRFDGVGRGRRAPWSE